MSTVTDKSVRVQTLHHGAELTDNNRDSVYGDPKINLACAGELKRVIRKWMAISRGRSIGDGELEAIDLALTKISRIVTGHRVHHDNYCDGAVYFAIAYECASSDPPRLILSGDAAEEIERELTKVGKRPVDLPSGQILWLPEGVKPEDVTPEMLRCEHPSIINGHCSECDAPQSFVVEHNKLREEYALTKRMASKLQPTTAKDPAPDRAAASPKPRPGTSS